MFFFCTNERRRSVDTIVLRHDVALLCWKCRQTPINQFCDRSNQTFIVPFIVLVSWI